MTGWSREPVKVEIQQVANLVERPIEIVEYHRHTCVCQQCGNEKTADWSPDLVPGQDIGIRLQAFLGWINNYGHLPYQKQQELLWELGQIEIGVGTLVTTNERIDNAVDKSVNSLKEWIQQKQPNIHIDETPWVVKGVKEWLWIFVNTDFALFHAADTRSRAELESILGWKYKHKTFLNSLVGHLTFKPKLIRTFVNGLVKPERKQVSFYARYKRKHSNGGIFSLTQRYLPIIILQNERYV
jgi:transposase